MRGKLIVIEGTDCSGKGTQSDKILERLNNDGIKCVKFSFPNYNSPTGKIVGGPYLGKKYICDGWFSEGAANVDPKVSCLYFAADRLYNIKNINNELEKGNNVILDRYIYSNMAHQGGKIKDDKERHEMYNWLEKLEFELLGLPHADIKIFLHMPYEYAKVLGDNGEEAKDQNESSEEHLINAEKAYIEIADLYNFKKIECVSDNKVRTIEDINDELYQLITK